MRSVNLPPHNLLGFKIFQLLIGATVTLRRVRGSLLRSSQRLRSPNRPSRSQRGPRQRSSIRIWRCRSRRARSAHRGLSYRAWRRGVHHLSAIANYVVVPKVIAVETAFATIIVLPLPPRRGKETLLALSSTSHTWWIAWIVNTSQVAFDLAPPTRYASLVHTFVLWRFLLN